MKGLGCARPTTILMDLRGQLDFCLTSAGREVQARFPRGEGAEMPSCSGTRANGVRFLLLESKPNAGSNKSWMRKAFDGSDGEMCTEQLALKGFSKELAVKFRLISRATDHG